MDISVRIKLSCRLNEGVYEIVVFLSSNSRFPDTQVQVVIQKVLIVCSTV